MTENTNPLDDKVKRLITDINDRLAGESMASTVLALTTILNRQSANPSATEHQRKATAGLILRAALIGTEAAGMTDAEVIAVVMQGDAEAGRVVVTTDAITTGPAAITPGMARLLGGSELELEARIEIEGAMREAIKSAAHPQSAAAAFLCVATLSALDAGVEPQAILDEVNLQINENAPGSVH